MSPKFSRRFPPPKLRQVAWALALALIVAPSAVQARQAAFHAEYTVAVKDTAAHLFHVTATFSGLHLPRLELALPAWTPGWYTIENYAKNVLRFTVTDGAGKRLPAPLSHASTWSIDTRGKSKVTAEFDYSATVSAVNQAKVTSTYAFFTGTQLFLEPVGHRAASATVRFVLPTGWRIATALRDTKDSTVFTATDYDALVDAPTMLGTFDLFPFDVDGTPHYFVEKLSAPVAADSVAAATAKFATMVRTERAIFGSLPYEKYLVFYLPDTAESHAQGALEHGNSFVVATGPMSALPQPNAHEFFHVWNVKLIRPAEMWPYDYARPNESPSLWVSEGFTDYYHDLVFYRAGFINDTSYVATLANAIGFVESNDARAYISPSDASISTWLGYDTPVAFSTSYYVQGHVLGALLDLSLRHDTHGGRGLDDVMRALYAQFYQKGKGFTPRDMLHTVGTVAGRDYTTFFDKYVTGVDTLPYDMIFAYAGYRRSEQVFGYLGLFGQMTPQGYRINGTGWDSPASRAGIRKDDILVTADGLPMKPGGPGRGVGAPGQRIVYGLLRDGKELQLPATLGARRVVRLQSDSLATPEQLIVRKSWLARFVPTTQPK